MHTQPGLPPSFPPGLGLTGPHSSVGESCTFQDPGPSSVLYIPHKCLINARALGALPLVSLLFIALTPGTNHPSCQVQLPHSADDSGIAPLAQTHLSSHLWTAHLTLCSTYQPSLPCFPKRSCTSAGLASQAEPPVVDSFPPRPPSVTRTSGVSSQTHGAAPATTPLPAPLQQPSCSPQSPLLTAATLTFPFPRADCQNLFPKSHLKGDSKLC